MLFTKELQGKGKDATSKAFLKDIILTQLKTKGSKESVRLQAISGVRRYI